MAGANTCYLKSNMNNGAYNADGTLVGYVKNLTAAQAAAARQAAQLAARQAADAEFAAWRKAEAEKAAALCGPKCQECEIYGDWTYSASRGEWYCDDA